MADNYLEKKMDDYRRGTSGSPRLWRNQRPAHHGFELRPVADSVMVFVNRMPLRDSLIEAFVKTGCRTAFCWHDYREGQLTAQRTGSLACPVTDLSPLTLGEAAATVASRWGTLGLIVTDVPEVGECHGDIPMIYIGDRPVPCTGCSVVAVSHGESRLSEIASSAVLLAALPSRARIELY